MQPYLASSPSVMLANSCDDLSAKVFCSSSAAIRRGLRSRYAAPPSSFWLTARKISSPAQMPLAIPLAQIQKRLAALARSPLKNVRAEQIAGPLKLAFVLPAVKFSGKFAHPLVRLAAKHHRVAARNLNDTRLTRETARTFRKTIRASRLA